MARVGVSGPGLPGCHGRWRRLPGLLLVLAGLVSYLSPVSHSQASANAVHVVQIRGEIDLGVAPYLSRVLDQAHREGARAVIIEIETPGGRLDAALQMREAILRAPVRTIAFVNRDAFSAGALIAISATEIYMAPGAVMGAATPVKGTGETASEKTISAVRSTFKSTAEARGRDPLIAEAMVDPSVEIPGLVAPGQLLTLTATEALARSYADGIVEDRLRLLRVTGLADAAVEETSPSLAEQAVRFLTNPVVTSLLLAAGVLLIVADLFSGSLGAAGAGGAALLAVFFWGHMLAGLAGWEGVALVLLGLVLLALEVLVIPGFGVAGVLGIAALAGGLFLSLIGGEIVTNDDLVRAGMTVGFALLMSLGGGLVLLLVLSGTAGFQGLVLRARLGPPDGPSYPERGNGRSTAVPTTEVRASTEARRAPSAPPSLLGARGVTLSDLRPGGFARIGGDRVDVVTEGDYVQTGELVEVIGDEGYRRVVRRLERDAVDTAVAGSARSSSSGPSEGGG